MEMRQLEAFAAVMSTGSVTGAARMLARSQPAVTRLVQELEAEIGYPLFMRNGPRVTPTAQGLRLHEDAERALASLRLVHSRAADIALGEPDPMLLAATSALAVGLLPQALKQVEAHSGATTVHLRTASPEQVMQSVLNGEVQLGISSLPLEHRGLDLQWIGQLDCVAVMPRGDPLAKLDRVPLAALATRRLITMSNPYRLRHRLDAVLAESGEGHVAARALIETNSSINAQALVRAGLGIAVLEPLTAHGAPFVGVVTRPLDTAIPFFFGAVTPQAKPVSAPVRALSDALLEVAAAMPGFVRHQPSAHASLLKAIDTGTAPRSNSRKAMQ
ncbi:MAG: LysR family transcriptional regulator [Ideonella sp.]